LWKKTQLQYTLLLLSYLLFFSFGHFFSSLMFCESLIRSRNEIWVWVWLTSKKSINIIACKEISLLFQKVVGHSHVSSFKMSLNLCVVRYVKKNSSCRHLFNCLHQVQSKLWYIYLHSLFRGHKIPLGVNTTNTLFSSWWL
jgi:hypothetical protein